MRCQHGCHSCKEARGVQRCENYTLCNRDRGDSSLSHQRTSTVLLLDVIEWSLSRTQTCVSTMRRENEMQRWQERHSKLQGCAVVCQLRFSHSHTLPLPASAAVQESLPGKRCQSACILRSVQRHSLSCDDLRGKLC